MAHVKTSHKWQKEDFLICLDFYLNHREAPVSQSHPGLIELTNLLNRLPVNSKNNPLTPKSIYMKLMNFMSLDPHHPNRGLSNITQRDKDIWAEYSEDSEELKKVVEAIKSNIEESSETILQVEHSNEIVSAREGKLLSSIHIKRERNQKLVKHKKQKVLKQTGKLECEVCSFDFNEVYGQRGFGFIECHHTLPLSSLKGATTINLEDLALVCSNCHRMIHVKQPWLTIEELRKLRNLNS